MYIYIYIYMYRSYPFLLFLRVVTGTCQGAVVPVLFSLIGDYYDEDERPTYSAIVSSCLGGGLIDLLHKCFELLCSLLMS
jgi:sugar phosphate permease